MTAQLHAYLHFDGTTRQAFEFYHACLGGELHMTTVADSPMSEQMPPEAKEQIIHAALTYPGGILMGSDMIGQGTLMQGNTVSLVLICTSKKEIKALFTKLAKGGKVTDPLKEHFFGTFGALTDKFGMEWLVQMDPPKQN